MKSSFSVKAGKIIGVAGLAGGLLLLAALYSTGKQTLLKGPGASPEMTSGASRLPATKENPRWMEAHGTLPLSFEANEGQTAREVRYISHGSGYELFLTPQEAVVALQPSLAENLSALHRAAYFRALRRARQAGRMTVLRMGLEGANLQAKLSGIDPLPGKVNYFLGNRPEHWHTNIPTYSRVKYAQVYPGVDLVFYGNQRNLEYDFVVAPGADPKAIALTLKGARKLAVDSKGDLILSLADGQVIFQKPVLYQTVQGQRKQIEGGYSLAGKQRVTFAVSEYDRTEPLIIDPVLNYSTYLGGSAAGDLGTAIAVDSLGDAFVTGTTFSTTFPTHNGFGAGNAKGVAFVSELNPSGTALLYSTYLGGTGGDAGIGIALDPSGNIYVAGETFSADFPTNSSVTPLKPSSPGAALGTSFVTKINPTANVAAQLVYSSYLGGTNGVSGIPDFANAIAADANGNAYVTGYTASSPGSGAANFPITTANAHQQTLGGTAGNAFLTKIDTTKNGAQSLIYSTYLGGNGADAVSSTQGFGDIGFGLALDSSKNVYIAGTTTSTNFPTTSTALQPNTAPPAAVAKGTAFVSRIDTTLSAATSLVYSTYLGGNVAEFGTAIAVKSNSTIAYITGTSSSPAFPTFPANTFQTAAGTVFPAAIVSLLDTSLPAGTALQYSTFLGGSNTTGFGIQADASGNAYVGGGTASTAFPVSKGAFQTAFAAGATSQGFVSRLDPGGKGAADLVYSTFFGGSGSASGADDINAIAIDTTNDAFITGVAFSSAATFPVFPPATATPPAFQTSLPSGDKSAAFVAKLTLIPPDFGLTGPTTVQNVTAGSTLTFNVTMTPMGSFTGSVALTCTGAPNLSTCTVNPTSVAAADGKTPQTAQVSLSTMALMVPPTRIPTPPVSIWRVVLVLVAMLLLFVLARAKQMRMRLAIFTATALLLALAACSGPKPGTTKGPATLTITGTSTPLALTHSVQVNISVN